MTSTVAQSITVPFMKTQTHYMININASTLINTRQLQTLSAVKYYSCPSFDKDPFSFDL